MINLNRFLSFLSLIVMFNFYAQDNSVLSIGKEMEFDYSKPKKIRDWFCKS